MSEKLPLLVSVPHGGDQIPPELTDRVVLTRHEVFWDGDALTREIYGVQDLAEAYIDTPIARAAVDLNRAEDDRPPANPDGVVKQTTCLGVPLYAQAALPSDADAQVLLEKYYRPYHERLARLASRDGVLLGLDCHSMLAEGPPVGPDHGKVRPMFCLGNRNGQTCSPGLLEAAQGLFANAFGLPESDVQLNRPFAGGYITRTYGNTPLPWMQIEMSRAMYLQAPWFDEPSLQVSPDRLQHLNRAFRQVLKGLAKALQA